LAHSIQKNPDWRREIGMDDKEWLDARFGEKGDFQKLSCYQVPGRYTLEVSRLFAQLYLVNFR
jgi:hypothetical protein